MNTDELQDFLDDLVIRMGSMRERGRVASYIPELARVDPRQFGISVCLASGEQLSAGDAAVPFSIQSISKVFALAIVLRWQGDLLWERVGIEPSNYAFNSVEELEKRNGKPRNPFVNAGALVTTDAMLDTADGPRAMDALLAFLRTAANDSEIEANERVAESEIATADRNFALAYFLRSCGNLHHSCEQVLQTYSRQCAVQMSCEQLARAGRFLAGFGERELLDDLLSRHINALMLTAGHYNGSAQYVYATGFPGKSGVGGGILSVIPHTAAIAVWSPGLNDHGNSQLGTQAMQELSSFTDWSIF